MTSDKLKEIYCPISVMPNKNTFLVMTKYIWSILAFCGLAIISYGIILFFAMPAAGAFVVVTGLICLNVGIRKSRKTGHILNGKQNKGHQNESLEVIANNKISIIARTLIFITNLIFIVPLLPHFKKMFGSDLGFVAQVLVGFIATWFYTGIMLSFFPTILSLAFVGLITWIAIVLRAMH